jgi:hypothetical protein
VSRFLAILHIMAALAMSSCKTHGLPDLPPERDPADERAAIVPYRAPPDVLTTELSTGEGAAAGHEHHHGHHMPAKPASPPEPVKPAEPATPPEPDGGHEHAGHGGGE